MTTTLSPTTDSGGSAPARLADGVELLGEYAGSGFKEPPYLARLGDGRLVQLPRLLYLVAVRADGRRSDAELADAVSADAHRLLKPEHVRYLLDEKLRPLGIVAGEDGAAALVPAANDFLALNMKKAVVPAEAVNVVAALLAPLFSPLVVLAVLAGVAYVDVWLFATHGIAQSIRTALYEPTTLLLLLGLVLVATAFHECGHAAGTRYGGARPGAIGAGLYLVWPAFYTELSDSYRLGRAGRLRADLGGVYFNAIFVLIVAGAYHLTGFEPLLLMIPFQHLEILHQLLPLLRLDGYYVISDLTGVPDILGRIRPILRSLLPDREPDPRVTALKPWVRVVVTAYVLLLVPVLAFLVGVMVLTAPRVFATAWDAFFVQLRATQHAVDARLELPTVVGALQLMLLALPPLGLALTLARLARRVTGGVWGATARRPRARNFVVALASATLTALVVSWWSNGAYRPIRAGDRGTVGGIRHLSPLGRPTQRTPTPVVPLRTRHTRTHAPRATATTTHVQTTRRPLGTTTQPSATTATSTSTSSTTQAPPPTTAPAATTVATTTQPVATTTTEPPPTTTDATTTTESTTPTTTTTP